jgi:hypothetical protein
MKLINEEQLLDENFRKLVLKEINGEENKERKKEARIRYDIFKDGTRKYVVERMKEELTAETFREVKHRTANISILRKIVDKKSMVYRHGALREANEHPKQDEYQAALDFYSDELNHNTKMKKVNKYLELQKNCAYFVAPYLNTKTGKHNLRSQVLSPYAYDVIPDAQNPEIPRVYVFSYFSPNSTPSRASEPNQSGMRPEEQRKNAVLNFRQGDGVDQIIADSPADQNEGMNYIWWSDTYHFTTNSKGEVLPGMQDETLLNPIGKMPIVNFAKDQDASFWAIGGDDLVSGAILINQLLTDMYFIAKLQGQGIFYLIGPKVPKTLKVGPSDAILMEVKEGDPPVQVGFASSSPPLGDHMSMIEQYVALLLSTNNLEPGTVRGELSATTAASGIQEIIRMSENIDDIEDQREVYRDTEPEIFDIVVKWHNLYLDRGVLAEDNAELGSIPEDAEFSLKFPAPVMFQTEKEKLEVIDKRRSLNLDSMIDSVMRDNTDLSREDAEAKLLQILEDKLKIQRIKLMQGMQQPPQAGEPNAEKQKKEIEGEAEERKDGEDEADNK